VAGSQEDATSGFALPNDMASCRSAQNTVLSDQELLDAIRSTDLRNQLHDLGVPVSAITANHQEAAFDAFRDREKDTRDKRLAVMRLLENNNLFPQTRPAQSSACVEEGAGAVMAGLHARSRLLVGKGSEGHGPDTHGFQRGIVCFVDSVVGVK
jgi:hypothetical protein